MGVFGLMSHCLGRREECMQFVDLVEVARDKGETSKVLMNALIP